LLLKTVPDTELLKSKHRKRIFGGTYINGNFGAVILYQILSKPVHLQPSSLK